MTYCCKPSGSAVAAGDGGKGGGEGGALAASDGGGWQAVVFLHGVIETLAAVRGLNRLCVYPCCPLIGRQDRRACRRHAIVSTKKQI